jgi:LacI family transcriptional regulator
MAGIKSVTINDVAAAAGVSRATVSRALSGYGRINEQTIEHVRATAERIGYRPNALAAAMRAGKTKTIGLVVISDFTNAFFDRATKAIIDQAKELGYRVLISHTDENIAVEKAAVETMLSNQVDGLILVPSGQTQHSHLTPKKLNGKPVVIIDRKLDTPRFTTITTGDQEAAKEAVLHATENGHTNLGFLIAVPGIKGFKKKAPEIPITSVQERADGFAEGVSESKPKPKSAIWIYCEDEEVAAGSAVEEMLDSPTPPSIIFTSNNDMLLAVLKIAGTRGLAIGKDLSVISFDDSPWAAAMVPGITVIARPVEDLGHIAVTELIEAVEGKAKPKEIVLEAHLIRRGSVAKLHKAK